MTTANNIIEKKSIKTLTTTQTNKLHANILNVVAQKSCVISGSKMNLFSTAFKSIS